jgi:mannose-1-phosphate guanylyltransferase
VGRGLYGYPADGYWLDIGTPDRYLQGTYDILEGNVVTEIGRRLGEAGLALQDGADVQGRVVAPALLGAGSTVAFGAIVGGRTVLGENVTVGTGAHVESSVLLDGPGAQIGDHCHVEDRVVLGEGVKVGSDNVLTAGARIFPGVQLPEGAIKF